MPGDSGHPASNNRPHRSGLFGSLAPGARPRRLWLAFLVIALLGATGIALLLLL